MSAIEDTIPSVCLAREFDATTVLLLQPYTVYSSSRLKAVVRLLYAVTSTPLQLEHSYGDHRL